jgi:Putative peptidoglycan binding domain
MELPIQLLPLIFSAMNTMPQFQQAIAMGHQLYRPCEFDADWQAPVSSHWRKICRCRVYDVWPVRVKWPRRPLDVDGEYGPLTTEAVQQFQKSKGLNVEGGQETSLTQSLQAAMVC